MTERIDLKQNAENLELSATRQHLSKLGYTDEGVNFIVSKIIRVLSKFGNPEEALRIFDESFPKFVNSRFGERQFFGFLKDIDPTNEASHIFPVDYDYAPLEDWEKEEMTPSEIDEFNKEREEYLRGYKDEKLMVLADEWTYEALTSAHYRASKRDQVDESKLPKPRPPISTPIGGQPGFKRKWRFR